VLVGREMMDERTSSKNAHEAAGWAWGWRLSLA